MKHDSHSVGNGAVAGIAVLYRKSPVGFARWKMIVWSSGVSIPETGEVAELACPSIPLMTPL